MVSNNRISGGERVKNKNGLDIIERLWGIWWTERMQVLQLKPKKFESGFITKIK